MPLFKGSNAHQRRQKISHKARDLNLVVMPAPVARLSGSFFVDKVHGVDSSVLKRLATF